MLNEYRQSLLNQLIEKRNSQLAQINEQKDESLNDRGLFMEKVEASVKPNTPYFNKSDSSFLYNFIVNKFRFNQIFDFMQIQKYYSFIFIEKNIYLNIPDSLTIKTLNGIAATQFYILPNNHMLMLVETEKLTDMLIVVDKNGKLKHSLEFGEKDDFQELGFSDSKIIRLFEKRESVTRTYIEIYSFELKLINSFCLNCLYRFFITYKNLVLFTDIYSNKCLFYDVELKKFKNLKLNLNQTETRSELFHYDGAYYYICNEDEGYVYIVDHKTLELHATIKINHTQTSLHYFRIDKSKNVIFFDYMAKQVNIYDSNGKFIVNQQLTLEDIGKYFGLDISKFGNFLCRKRCRPYLIQYHIY